MPTSRQDIRRWFSEGVRQGATHLIVVCDTFDWEDYPVYVLPGEVASEKCFRYHRKEMQKVMEVYDLKKSIGDQVNANAIIKNF